MCLKSSLGWWWPHTLVISVGLRPTSRYVYGEEQKSTPVLTVLEVACCSDYSLSSHKGWFGVHLLLCGSDLISLVILFSWCFFIGLGCFKRFLYFRKCLDTAERVLVIVRGFWFPIFFFISRSSLQHSCLWSCAPARSAKPTAQEGGYTYRLVAPSLLNSKKWRFKSMWVGGISLAVGNEMAGRKIGEEKSIVG